MSKVAIMKCTLYDQALLQSTIGSAIEALGGWQSFVRPGYKVLLKVNMIGPLPPEKAATTHPEFVRAVVRQVKACGAEVWVGDSAGGAIAGIAPTARALEVCGYARVCREEGARVINFDSEGAVAVPSLTQTVFPEFYIAKALVDADVVINLPKFKSHSAQLYTGAVKNLFGALPGLSKATYHQAAPDQETFGELVADLHRACQPRLHIMDGVTGHEGNGPTAGSPRDVGVILASTDPVALDSTACRMMGIDPQRVTVVKHAARLGLGTLDEGKITLLGDYSTAPRVEKWRLPSGYGMRGPQWLLPGIIRFFRTRPVVNSSQCKHCNMCVESCPVKAIEEGSKRINYEGCIGCLCCHELCQHHAVELRRSNPLAALIMRRIERNNHKQEY